jgi:hypothetical protein
MNENKFLCVDNDLIDGNMTYAKYSNNILHSYVTYANSLGFYNVTVKDFYSFPEKINKENVKRFLDEL